MKPGSIIPSNVASLRSLTVTMAVMSYLACLAIGALILVERAVTSWTSGLSQEMTVQVAHVRGARHRGRGGKGAEPSPRTSPAILEAEVLAEEAGAKTAGTLARDAVPSKGCRCRGSSASWSMPANPPDLEALEKALSEVKGAHLDTHRKWEAELTRMARALSVLSYAILFLISVSAIAIVIFATRAVLQANRPIVDLLHLVGARDSYIARQIDGRFLRTGMLSGFIGVGLGLLTFLLLGLSGGGGMAAASRSLLFSAPEIAIWSYAFLFAVPVAATLICLITARVTLMRRLGVIT